ncbi:MAG: 3-hydroxyisobutyrate dehydrogenase [Pseudomonadota bacterium]
MIIGFIGLGNMGAPMARNLAAAGHDVRGFDVSGAAVEGVSVATSAADAASGAEVVITMLPGGAILRDVATRILPVLSAGSTFVDCSTVDVDSARAVAADALSAGVEPVDAPVSGGIGGATAGTLTFMAGGTEKGFNTALPLFDIMGQKSVHCGASGAGQAAKICNNMILGISMIGVCEAFAMAEKLKLDAQKMFDVVSTSSGACWSVNTYCPVPGVGPQSPSDNGYAPGFAAALMLKDLRLAQDAATSVGSPTPMGARAAELYEAFVAADTDALDFSAMLPWLSGQARDVLE